MMKRLLALGLVCLGSVAGAQTPQRGWEMSALPATNFNSDDGGTLSLNTFSVTSVSGDRTPDWLTTKSTGTLDSEITIAEVVQAGTGSTSLDVDLEIDIPADTEPGSYSATLTVTITGEDPEG